MCAQFGVNDRLEENYLQHEVQSSGICCQQSARPVPAGTGRYSILESVINAKQQGCSQWQAQGKRCAA